MTENKL
jgi:hypothetical protein